jgi:hypothetical protein
MAALILHALAREPADRHPSAHARRRRGSWSGCASLLTSEARLSGIAGWPGPPRPIATSRRLSRRIVMASDAVLVAGGSHSILGSCEVT